MKDKLSTLAISLIEDVGPLRYRLLIDAFGAPDAVFKADLKSLTAVDKITLPIARRILSKETLKLAEEELKKAEKLGIKIYSQDDEEYPYELKNIPDPPIVIYVSGELKKTDYFSVAIVGTRRATNYGMSVAKKLSQELSAVKITTVSGLARGIDTEVHKATLAVNGRTIAVLGNGLCYYYPPENRRLQLKIAESGGAVISEFPLNARPEPGSFPRRNRIISALALATVVVEADETSGALITARSALEQGKDVFAVPGNIFSKYSQGPHSLIKKGAKLLSSIQDIVEEIVPLAKWISKQKDIRVISEETEVKTQFTEKEKKILNVLESDMDGVSIELIESKTGMNLSEVMECLLNLELKGVIKSLPGKQYAIIKPV